MHRPSVNIYSELNFGKKTGSLGAFYFQNFKKDYSKKSCLKLFISARATYSQAVFNSVLLFPYYDSFSTLSKEIYAV